MNIDVEGVVRSLRRFRSGMKDRRLPSVLSVERETLKN